MLLAKVEFEKIVTCVTSHDKFRWAELFIAREASRFATDGRNSAARQFAFAWMSSWLHLEHAYQARRHKPAVNNYCEGRYGARQSGRSILRATTGMITILYACLGQLWRVFVSQPPYCRCVCSVLSTLSLLLYHYYGVPSVTT